MLLSGSVSKAKAAPTPHSPPIATPNNARMTSNDFKEGANADPNSNTEYAMMSTMSVTRRPNRSAIIPNRNAPTGRIASVQAIALTTAEVSAWNCLSMALMQKVRMKKSNASSDQPRKHATNVLRCTGVSLRKWPMNSIEVSSAQFPTR